MSDKIKYSALVDQITKDLDKSPEFMTQMRKHMGDVLREGLEKDGSAHLGGFGTFYLKWSDAREGRNPKTGEKIDVPAHNHISFRPDASVRRVINKDYDHLKAFILDENDKKQKSKIPVWVYGVLAVLLIAVVALVLNPKEVIEEVIVTEEVVVEKEVVVVEEVIVTNEVAVIEEVVVIKEVPVPAEAPAAAAAPTSDANDIVADINAMPDADDAMKASHDLEAPPADDSTGAYVDPDVAAAEAGFAQAKSEEAIDDAEVAAAKATVAEEEINKFDGAEKAEEAEATADKAKAKAEQAMADYMKADDVADEAAEAAKEAEEDQM